ncbi:hypothetical protein [Nonomuraea sp. NPDC049646]|uniref:hypothetical protein n=1 Tax=unclassified Nonomuraea TaxID=2593643 RepID=UPI0037A5C6F1
MLNSLADMAVLGLLAASHEGEIATLKAKHGPAPRLIVDCVGLSPITRQPYIRLSCTGQTCTFWLGFGEDAPLDSIEKTAHAHRATCPDGGQADGPAGAADGPAGGGDPGQGGREGRQLVETGEGRARVLRVIRGDEA